MNYIYMDTPVGHLTLGEDMGEVTHVLFGKRPLDGFFLETDTLRELKCQLTEYFNGQRREFYLPLCPQGTEFQLKVWNALQKIGYGETATYKDIAKMAGNEKACRAVGMANNKNPIAIIIP